MARRIDYGPSVSRGIFVKTVSKLDKFEMELSVEDGIRGAGGAKNRRGCGGGVKTGRLELRTLAYQA